MSESNLLNASPVVENKVVDIEAEAQKAQAEEKQYLDNLYKKICQYCSEKGYACPPEGIVDPAKMHVCAFDPAQGFTNPGFYEFLGTKACLATKKGENWKDNVKKAFNFPLLVNANSSGGSCGAVVIPYFATSKKFLLLNEWRLPIGGFSCNFPRGFPDKAVGSINKVLKDNVKNEKENETATRELKEETGLVVKKNNLIDLGFIFENNGISYNKTAVYLSVIDEKPNFVLEDNANAELLSQNEIYELVAKGNNGDDGIVDSFTLAVMLKLLVYWSRK